MMMGYNSYATPLPPSSDRWTSERSASAVTVVIPVWDDYVTVLMEAIASVQRQGPVSKRIIVVNNRSRRPLPPLPSDVSIVSLKQRASAGASRNAGLAATRTEFVLFLDADDIMVQGTLHRLLSLMKARPDVSACCSRVLAWNAHSGRTSAVDFPSERTRRLASWDTAFRLYCSLENRMPTTGCLLMRTAAARDAGGFADANFAEDWALNVSLSFRGRVAFLDHPGRLLRVHETSLTAWPRHPNDVAAMYRQVRRRLRTDAATPSLVRALLPLIALIHRKYVRRRTRVVSLGGPPASGPVGPGDVPLVSMTPRVLKPEAPLGLTTAAARHFRE
jgi:cellulose synthase/poly-beta-1,6-N-acetylglucosamine synthase-like glycosyltransferase